MPRNGFIEIQGIPEPGIGLFSLILVPNVNKSLNGPVGSP